MSPARGGFSSRGRGRNNSTRGSPHHRRGSHQHNNNNSNSRRYYKNTVATTTSADGQQVVVNPLNCTICKTQPSKYRCPHCTGVKYCSVVCNKVHQNSGDCQKDRQSLGVEGGVSSTQPPITAEPIIIAPAVDDTTGTARPDYVTAKQLTALAHDKSIRSALREPELQHIIQRIDSAADRSGVLERYLRNNSDFRAFVESMIHTIEQ